MLHHVAISKNIGKTKQIQMFVLQASFAGWQKTSF